MVDDSLKIIYKISLLFWILPAFKNRKTQFFLYFLLLALEDPIARIHRYIFGFHIHQLHFVVITILQLFTLIRWKRNESGFIFLGISLIVCISSSLIINDGYFDLLIMLLFFLAALFQIIKLFAMDIYQASRINYFYIALMFYQLTIVMKFLVVLVGANNYYFDYITTGIAQIGMGIFFSIFNVNSKSLHYNLKNVKLGESEVQSEEKKAPT